MPLIALNCSGCGAEVYRDQYKVRRSKTGKVHCGKCGKRGVQKERQPKRNPKIGDYFTVPLISKHREWRCLEIDNGTILGESTDLARDIFWRGEIKWAGFEDGGTNDT